MHPSESLPHDWTVRAPEARDVDALHRLAAAHDTAAVGRSTTSPETVAAQVTGRGAATRRHAVVVDPAGTVAGWASLQDRASGRVIVAVQVDPGLGGAGGVTDDGVTDDGVAARLFAWVEDEGRRIGLERGLEVTQLDAGAFADDERQHRWLRQAGYEHVRTWWQMSRPVRPEEGTPDAFPPPQPGVRIRQVVDDDGEPDQDALRQVHDVLEAAFTDHFNYHEETFDEFVARQRQEVGHAWDHWWIAELEDDGAVGALVGEVSPGGGGAPDGSYVSYLGVTAAARGRGVARSLLHEIITDAAARGRDRVSLEVDAESPTGANALYESLGFQVGYVTHSWHRDLDVH